ncbi:hypothetical protein I7I51_04160, partial [Histoplasma capsulatum]
MSPAYYETQEDLQFCRNSTRGMSYPVSQPLRGDAQQPAGGYSNRICSTTQPEMKGSGTSVRRRIPVAVGPLTQLKYLSLYLSVNSFNTQTKSHYSCSWPYPGTGPLGGPFVSNTGYEAQVSSRANSISIHSMAPTFPLYSKSQCAYDQATQFAPISRSPYISVNYEGDSSPYSVSSPPYILPNTDSSGSSSYYSFTGSPRTSPVVKTPNEDIYHDQDGHPTLGSNYNYMTQTQPPTSVSTELPSAHGLLSAMSSSSSGPDRILPNPAASRNGRDNGSTTNAHSPETSLPSYGTSPGLNARSSSHSALEGLSSSSQQNTMRTTTTPSTMANSANSPSTSKSLIGPTDMGFGYVLSSNPPATTMPSTTFSGTESVAGFSPPTENTLSGPSHRGGELRQRTSCGAQSYGHSTMLSAHRSSGT